MTEPTPSELRAQLKKLQQEHKRLTSKLADEPDEDIRVVYERKIATYAGEIARLEQILQPSKSRRDTVGRDKIQKQINTGGAPYYENATITQQTQSGPSEADLRESYLNRLITELDQLPLFKNDASDAQRRLSQIYTALITRHDLRTISPQPTSKRAKQRKRDEDFMRERPIPASALEMLNGVQHLVLLGGPGSGKSTFVNFVAVCMAGEMLGDDALNLKTLCTPLPPNARGDEGENPKQDKKDKDTKKQPEPQPWRHGAQLPVHIVLRDFAASLTGRNKPVDANTLWEHIVGKLEAATLAQFAPVLQAELLNRGGLILLDGLDEVPDADQRREQVKLAVQGFVATYGKCRYLVTSRTYAYQQQDWKLDGFTDAELRSFTPGQIDSFIDVWYAHMVNLMRLTETDAKDRADKLRRTLRNSDNVRDMAQRPLLLTLMVKLQTEGNGILPDLRHELYEASVVMLLNQWEEAKVAKLPNGEKVMQPSLTEWLKLDARVMRQQLERVIFEAHRDQAQLEDTADIRRSDLLTALLDACGRQSSVQLGQLENYLRDRAGLLASHGEGLYQLPHRSFQEYLAACHLSRFKFPDELWKLLRADVNRWRESALLAAALAKSGIWDMVERLCYYEPDSSKIDVDTDAWMAYVAAQALHENKLAIPSDSLTDIQQGRRKKVQQWLRTIVERGWLPPIERAKVGELLAVMGDDRDLEELVTIQEGEFWMGSDNGQSREKPRHRVSLPTYRIGKYPVTNALYARFIRSTRQEWNSNEREQPTRSNHPAANLTWFDAMAFCKWLTTEWRRIGKIGAQDMVTLPSEAEWEYAAVGPDGRTWPWGNKWHFDCANIDDTKINDTSAVGIFQGGRSYYGLLDMAGNVWEWTRSTYESYPYEAGDGRETVMGNSDDRTRVLRGGAFNGSLNFARCAFRLYSHPENGYLGFGFRVVVLSPSTSDL